MTRAADNILARLPHGPSFCFLTEVRSLSPGESVVAAWRVDGSEEFFAAHFPGDPIVPGVLLTEALAQAAGLIVGGGPAGIGKGGALLCHIDVRLHEPVAPPATITLEATLTRALNGLFLFEVAAHANGTAAASGRLTLAARREQGAPGSPRSEPAP